MPRSLKVAIACLLAAVFTCVSTGCNSEPFTVIAMPDTQVYSMRLPDIYMSQTNWVVEHKDNMNIVFLAHEGDVTNSNHPHHWKNADRAMSVLDGKVPYAIALGNHDIGTNGNACNRNSDHFNKHFPVSRFENEPSYGGHYGDNNDNSYHFFTGGGMKFMVIALEFGPRDEVLAWANEIIAKHPDHRTIILTHSYLDAKGKFLAGNAGGSPHTYPCKGNDGQEMWDKLVRKHTNIFLVLCGHISGEASRMTSKGDHGNTVHQVMANYQFGPKGGNGWMRLMRFVPKENKIYVLSYSPYLNKYKTKDKNQFVLEYKMTGW